MTTISISELKINPSAAILKSQDYPIAVQNRNDTEAYLVGKDIFEKMILYLEDLEDKKAVDSLTAKDYKNSISLEDFTKELGLG